MRSSRHRIARQRQTLLALLAGATLFGWVIGKAF